MLVLVGADSPTHTPCPLQNKFGPLTEPSLFNSVKPVEVFLLVVSVCLCKEQRKV